MRDKQLPSNPEALRPILDSVLRFLDHHMNCQLEIGTLQDTEAEFGDCDWHKERVKALLRDITAGLPGQNIFMDYIDWPFEWDLDGSRSGLSFENALRGYATLLMMMGQQPSDDVGTQATRLRLEIMELLDAPLPTGPGQDRLKVKIDGGDSEIILDGVSYPADLVSATYVDSLVRANGYPVSFKWLQDSKPELLGAVVTREMNKLDPKILEFIERAKGAPARLKVKELRQKVEAQ